MAKVKCKLDERCDQCNPNFRGLPSRTLGVSDAEVRLMIYQQEGLAEEYLIWVERLDGVSREEEEQMTEKNARFWEGGSRGFLCRKSDTFGFKPYVCSIGIPRQLQIANKKTEGPPTLRTQSSIPRWRLTLQARESKKRNVPRAGKAKEKGERHYFPSNVSQALPACAASLLGAARHVSASGHAYRPWSTAWPLPGGVLPVAFHGRFWHDDTREDGEGVGDAEVLPRYIPLCPRNLNFGLCRG